MTDDVYLGGEETVLRFGAGGKPCSGEPVGQQVIFNGSEGVTIADGALYTRNATVTLTVRPPGGATDVLISNDGGFTAPVTRKLADLPGGRVDWTLVESGLNERLPRTVYVRFASPTATSAQTFTDDIILDTVRPKATLATYRLAGGATAAARRRRFLVRVVATDNLSGVATMQFAVSRRRPAAPRTYKRRSTISAARPPAYVRVTDRAGNVSGCRCAASGHGRTCA